MTMSMIMMMCVLTHAKLPLVGGDDSNDDDDDDDEEDFNKAMEFYET